MESRQDLIPHLNMMCDGENHSAEDGHVQQGKKCKRASIRTFLESLKVSLQEIASTLENFQSSDQKEDLVQPPGATSMDSKQCIIIQAAGFSVLAAVGGFIWYLSRKKRRVANIQRVRNYCRNQPLNYKMYDGENDSIEDGPEAESAAPLVKEKAQSSGSVQRGKKRKRASRSAIFESLMVGLQEIVSALKSLQSDWRDELLGILMKFEGEEFDSPLLERAYKLMYEDEVEGMPFVEGMDDKLRVDWLREFASGHLG